MDEKKELKEVEKLKSLSPLVVQVTLRKLGMFSSSYMGNDIYFLMEAINLLISDIGEDYIEKKYKEQGKDWLVTKKKIEDLNKLIIKVKVFYDPIQNKKFDKKGDVNKVQAMFKKFFTKTASKVSLMQRDLFDLFIFLIKQTTIQRNQIPNEAFKIIEHSQFRKIDMTKRPASSTATSVT